MAKGDSVEVCEVTDIEPLLLSAVFLPLQNRRLQARGVERLGGNGVDAGLYGLAIVTEVILGADHDDRQLGVIV